MHAPFPSDTFSVVTDASAWGLVEYSRYTERVSGDLQHTNFDR